MQNINFPNKLQTKAASCDNPPFPKRLSVTENRIQKEGEERCYKLIVQQVPPMEDFNLRIGLVSI